MSTDDLLDRARETFRSGPFLPRRARKKAVRTLIVATEHDDESLPSLVDALLDIQLWHPYVKPVLLVGTADTTSVRSSGLLYESCFGPDELALLQVDGSWSDYRRDRITTMIDIYAPDIVLELQAGATLAADAATGRGR